MSPAPPQTLTSEISMKTIRAFLGALFVATSCFAIGCAAQVDDPAGGDVEQNAPAASEQTGEASPEQTGEADQPLITSCMTKCVAQDPDDPYIYDNCHCMC